MQVTPLLYLKTCIFRQNQLSLQRNISFIIIKPSKLSLHLSSTAHKFLPIVTLILLCQLAYSPLANATEAHPSVRIPLFYVQWEKFDSQTLMQMGRHYIDTETCMDSALVCYSIVGGRWNAHQPKAEQHRAIMAHNNKGYIYTHYYHDYQKAYNALQQAFELSGLAADSIARCYIYLNLGNLYSLYAQNQMSEEVNLLADRLYSQSVRLAAKERQWNICVTAMSNLLGGSLEKKRTHAIRPDIEFFLQQDIPDTIPMLRYARLAAEGRRLIAEHKYDAAIATFLRQLDCLDDGTISADYRMQALCAVGECYLLRGDIEGELSYLHKALQTARQYKMLSQQVDILYYIYKTYEELHRDSLYRQYRYEYLDLRDSLDGLENVESIKDMHFLYELKKVEDQKNEIINQRQQRTYALVLALTILAFIIVGVFILRHKNAMLRQRNTALYGKIQEMLRLESLERDARLASEAARPADKYRTSTLTEENKQLLLHKIHAVFDTSDEFLSASFNIERLAELVGSNQKYVSQVINELCGKSFNMLLGDHRIHEACRRMNDHENYGNLTIEAFSHMVGFNSRTTFIQHFTRVTGMTPSDYFKQAQK